MSLHAEVRLSLGTLALDTSLAATSGEVVALLGPNGAGKTTLLRVLAGLEAIDTGAIVLDDETLDDPAEHVFIPPEGRSIGVMFQQYLLFPTMSVLDNVAFSMRARHLDKDVALRVAHEWLERVGLDEYASVRPSELSGGQAQRVALARALARRPRLLLLDEPLAALDVGSRRDVRRDLRRHLDGFDGVTLIVTHDLIDAYALASRVVVLEGGSVMQDGLLTNVIARPRSPYVASLADVNLIAGTAAAGVLTTPSGGQISAADPIDGAAFVAIAPHSVALYLTRPDGSPRNVWPGTVSEIDRQDHRIKVHLEGPIPLIAEITANALVALHLQPGDTVWSSVKATEIAIYAI